MERANVHLLVIEDNVRFLNELMQWLQEEFGYPNIETATSAETAQEKLKSLCCDVVIADMRMERDDSGFAILDCVKENNLSAVVIILTANDTVADCRRAFREGAWDYISKNMRGSAFDTLDASIQDAIAYLNRWGSRPNQQWIDEHRDELESNYWGQWIAIANQTVIETAETEGELLKRLDERQLRRFTITVQRIGDLPPIAELIARGESDRLEFKSTLQWDIRQGTKNDKLQFGVLKTIVAFLNSEEGGVLLIGVEDDGSIFGLQKDLDTFKGGTQDKFERHLIQLIENKIGKQFWPCLSIRFATVGNELVCGVYVRPAAQSRAFLKSEKGIEFYIRTGNSTRSLSIPELYNYL